MEHASLLLIIVGAAIIAAVLAVRLLLRRGSPADHLPMHRIEPDVDPLFDDVGNKPAVEPRLRAEPPPVPAVEVVSEDVPRFREQAPQQRRPPRVAEDPRRVVVLNVVAGGQGFAGAAVREALAVVGFAFGEWQIFHFYAPDVDEPLFSLANMVKPGSFDPRRMDEMVIPGLSLFLVPAGEEGDVAAFDTMLVVARRLAEQLGGEVRDARRSVLTRQAVALIQEQLKEWRCRVKAAQH